MGDFDDWVQQQEKPSDFDVDAFMQERRKPKPKVALPRPKVQKPVGDRFRFDAPQSPIYSDEWLRGRPQPEAIPQSQPAPQPRAAPRLPRPAQPQPQPPQRRTPGGANDPFTSSLVEQGQRGAEMRQAEMERKQAEFAARPSPYFHGGSA